MAQRKTYSEETLLIAFERCSKRVREKFNTKLAAEGIDINYDQWLILKEILKSQGIIQRAVAKALAKETASVSRMCHKLENKGYITKRPSRDNKKAYSLYLTPAGIELCKDQSAAANKILLDAFSGIYERELNIVQDILKRVNKNF